MSDTTLAVLIGGAGRRMGFAKCCLRIHNMPILRFLHQQWAFDGPTMLVNAQDAAPPPGAELFSRIVHDSAAGDGPLRGIHAALAHAATAAVLVVTVDMPAVLQRHLNFLRTAADRAPASAADGIFLQREDHAFVDTFPCLLRRRLELRVRELLDNGVRSVQPLAREPNMRILAAPNWFMSALSTNLNTPADVAAFEAAHGDPDKEL